MISECICSGGRNLSFFECSVSFSKRFVEFGATVSGKVFK